MVNLHEGLLLNQISFYQQGALMSEQNIFAFSVCGNINF